MDEIRIEDLEVYAYHGVFPEEKEKGQTFFINAVLSLDTRKAGISDDLEQSVHYGEVSHLMDRWMKEHPCNLLEAVAEQMAREILLSYPLIKEVELEIRKPMAPIGLPFRSVSVCIRRGWHMLYLSVGSNMGDKKGHIDAALLALRENKDFRNCKVSELLVTKPYGGVEQDDFLNGIISVETLLTPRETLQVLHEIEAKEERKRLIHWGPRTLDLDIVFYDKLVYEDEELIIPHIDMENRYFVLKPLQELAPNFRHPILGKTVKELLASLSDAAENEQQDQ